MLLIPLWWTARFYSPLVHYMPNTISPAALSFFIQNIVPNPVPLCNNWKSILWRWNTPPARHLLICRTSADSKRLVYFYMYKKKGWVRRSIFWSVSFQSDIACFEVKGGTQENAVKTVFRTTPAPKGVSVMIRTYEHCALENRLHCASAVPRWLQEGKQEVTSELVSPWW